MKAPILSILAASAAVIFLPGGASAHDHSPLRGRLFFADHAKAEIRVLDLDSGKVTHTFPTTKPVPTLIPAEGGRHLIIRTGDDEGTIEFLDTGLIYESHDDHFDIEKTDVKKLDLSFTGDKPSHVVSENGWIALFYDGLRPWLGKSEPKVVYIKLDTMARDKPHVVVRAEKHPQHGIAVPLGDGKFLVSIAKESYAKGDDQTVSSRPNGFEILDKAKDWKQIANFNEVSDPARSCKEYHGHASLDGVHAFGCNARIEGDEKSDGGVLLVSKTADTWSSRKLAYADGRRTSTIKSSASGQYLIGNYGGEKGSPFDALVRIDPKAGAITDKDVFRIPEGQLVCHFEVTADGKRVVNLTQDGKLRVYELSPDWKEIATFDAVPRFDCAWDAQTPAPALSLIGSSAYVSDPQGGRIREFYLNTLTEGLDYPVGGTPTKIAGGGNPG